jgi:hypothetical protein
MAESLLNHLGRRVDWSRLARGRRPRADAADALDGVTHDVAGALRRRELSVRRHVDLTISSSSSPIQTTVTCGLPSALMVLR